MFFSFTFHSLPLPPAFPHRLSFRSLSSCRAKLTLRNVCHKFQFIREIFSYIYHTHILFSYTYWRKCNVFVEARFASVSGTNHPRDEEHDIPAGGGPAGNPIFVPGSTLLPAQPVGYRLKRVCSRVHETREKFNKSARAPFFHG